MRSTHEKADWLTARVLLVGFLALLIAEILVGLWQHESTEDLKAAARSGSVRDRAAALHKLVNREGVAGSLRGLVDEAESQDASLASFVVDVLETGTVRDQRVRRFLHVDRSHQEQRFYDLLFNQRRTYEDFRELLTIGASMTMDGPVRDESK